MKCRLLALLLVFSLLLCLAGCAEKPPVSEEPLRVGVLRGPTAMGLLSLMDDCSRGEGAADCAFTIAGSADELTPRFIKGELDVIAVPANLAAVLYRKTQGDTELLCINTLGVLSIAAKGESVSSFADLRGKTVYATGKGSAPEYTLRYLLQKNGLDPDADLTIEWKSEPTEAVALLQSAEHGITMLPQPYMTVALGAVEGLSVALDLTEEWRRVSPEGELLTGVAVVRRAYAEAHPETVERFLAAYAQSVAFLSSHLEESAELSETYGIVKAAVAKKAIPACNVTFLSGAKMREAAEGYLSVLYQADPASVGGNLPGDDFYYHAE